MKDFSIVKIGKSQYQVQKGQVFDVEKLDGKKGDKVVFDDVLLTSKKGKTKIGKPFLKGEKVEAKIVEQFKDKKIKIFKYTAKSRYRRKMGHRQQLTKLQVTKI